MAGHRANAPALRRAVHDSHQGHSLAAIIGVFELTRTAQETIERTFRSFGIYLVTAAIYFLICFPLTQFSQRAEARLQRP